MRPPCYTSHKSMAPDRYHHIVTTLSTVPGFGGLTISASVGAIVAIGLASMAIQATAPAGDASWIEHLTLTGALVIAVGVLWRALSAKDAQLAASNIQIVESTRVITVALSASAASNAELRKIIEESVTSKNHLTESLDLLRARLSHAPECSNYDPPHRDH